jgi:DNA-binding CsgD family transcriptional regulator
VLVDIPAASSAPMRGLFALMSAVLDRNAESACNRVANAGYGSALNEGLVGMGRAVILGRLGESAAAEHSRSDAASKLQIREMHALAHRFVAEAAIQDGWGDPAAWLRNALECFEQKGIVSPARACAALLRRLGEPVARRGRGDAEVPAELRSRGVTSREMDVLLLVGEGLSNTEIADRLFMSRRTVETHVSRLLEKTGTSNRGRLAAATATFRSQAPTHG